MLEWGLGRGRVPPMCLRKHFDNILGAGTPVGGAVAWDLLSLLCCCSVHRGPGAGPGLGAMWGAKAHPSPANIPPCRVWRGPGAI